MKVVKSKLSIAVLSLGFVSVIAAVAYASLNRAVVPEVKAKPTNKILTKAKLEGLEASLKKADKEANEPKAPHQKEVQDYLDQMKGYLQTPPRDGVFGSDRIPMLHGEESEGLKPYEAIRDLEGGISLRSTVLGLEPSATSKKVADVSLAEGVKLHDSLTGHIRLSDVHFVSPNYDNADENRWEKESEAFRQFAVDIRAKGLESDVQKVTVGGKPGWIFAKAVHASVDSCYKCHNNVKKGEPIGYVAALLTESKSQP